MEDEVEIVLRVGVPNRLSNLQFRDRFAGLEGLCSVGVAAVDDAFPCEECVVELTAGFEPDG